MGTMDEGKLNVGELGIEILYTYGRQRDSTVGGTFALHIANMVSIPITSMVL